MNFILFIGRHEHFCKMKKKKTLKDSLRKTMKNLCWEIHALGQRFLELFLELFHYLSEKNFIAKDF